MDGTRHAAPPVREAERPWLSDGMKTTPKPFATLYDPAGIRAVRSSRPLRASCVRSVPSSPLVTNASRSLKLTCCGGAPAAASLDRARRVRVEEGELAAVDRGHPDHPRSRNEPDVMGEKRAFTRPSNTGRDA